MHDEILHESMINHDLAFEDVTLNLGLLESSSGCSHFKKFDKIGCQYVQCILWVQIRALAQCPRQFSVSTENCLCGLGKQSGRVAKMAFISTGEISGSAGTASMINY